MLSRCKSIAGWPRRSLQGLSVAPIARLYGGPSAAIARLHEQYELSPTRILSGYAQGIFATGEPRNRIAWHCPPRRAIIASDRVHVSKRLKGYLRKDRFEIIYDRQFANVMQACADRETTWITSEIIDSFVELFQMGYAHSVEAYLGDKLVGGGYGVALGRVFFLESMFCREDHASKIAFVKLAEKLHRDEFHTIDCQFMTEHWRRFGAVEIDHEQFLALVVRQLNDPAVFSLPFAGEFDGTSAPFPVDALPLSGDASFESA